ncbi:MAG: Uma2 family endonuclease [Methylobacter sp.]|nr:Uma2 family endonuclease [Methylobacter sp.]
MSTAEKLQQRYTYADYAQWPDDKRWELINGEVHAMTAPLRLHQDIVFELAGQVRNYLRGKPCKGYVAPFDVRLPRDDEADDKVETIVQPDLSVICDQSKLDKLGCRGIPDWIVEVLSPSTMLKDMNTKRSLYEQHGLKEYWLVHPEDRWLMVYTLDEQGRYGQPGVFGMDEPTAVQLFPDLSIDWSFIAEA